MGNRVLLIGGNGFIGSHIADYLLKDGYAVRILDRYRERFRSPLSGVEYVEGDFSHPDSLKTALRGYNTVVHLAHCGVPATSVAAPEREVIDSIAGFSQMLDLLKGSDVERFLLFSSGGAVYGVLDQIPAGESFCGWPISPYGVAKIAMEKYLHMFSYLNGLSYQIIRPSNAYGPRQNFLGAQGVIAIFIHRILTRQTIEIWGDGSAVKDYIFISDLARAVLALLKSGCSNDVFNVGSGTCVSVNDLLAVIQDVTGLKADIKYTAVRRQDVQKVVLSCKKIVQNAGWQSEVGIREGITETAKWVQSVLHRD